MNVRRVPTLAVCAWLSAASAGLAQTPATLNLMPVPASVTLGEGALMLDSRFGVRFDGYKDARLERAVELMLQLITLMNVIPIVRSGNVPALTLKCGGAPAGAQKAIEDETYTLRVAPDGATLSAPSIYGILRGLETVTQLIEPAAGGFGIRAVTIADQPRFVWRGLLIDVCRHWMPVEVVKRNLDAMAAVKLNVLHWHLSEDQGFRVESKVYPLLHQKGSDGLYYTQEQVRDVVRYAADRGIRVVPEFDMPAHTQAWLAGYPELSAGKGPFEISRTWGVMDPVLDPTSERVYAFISRLLVEMTALFPDAYFHIGGDEVNGKQWDASPAVAAFKQRRGLKTNEDVQAYFNKRLSAMLKARGKTMVGWEEILHQDLPKNAVVQSWRGQKSLADAAAAGYQGILSNGYYLDYIWPAARHYAVDPMGQDAAKLSPEARARILGGEACMWAEWVTPETIDSRIWPRLAAIAERYWSPAAVTDVPDMYRRLSVVGQRLDVTGIVHRANYQPMLERLADYRSTEALRVVVDLVEPVKDYNRGRRQTFTSQTPLNRIVDAARPESDEARTFARWVDALLVDPARAVGRETIAACLVKWRDKARDAQPVMDGALLQEAVPLAQNLAAVASIGLRALDALETRTPLVLTPGEGEALAKAGTPVADVLLMVAAPVKKLAEAAKGQ